MKKRFAISMALLVCGAVSVFVGAEQDATQSTTTQYELELSKTLTLNPGGTPPVLENPEVVQPSSAWKTLAWLSLLAAAAWLAYGQGKSFQYRNSDRLKRQLVKTARQAQVLQRDLNKQKNGPRDEWRSTMNTFEQEIIEKNNLIDQLHDVRTQQDQEIKHSSSMITDLKRQQDELESAHASDKEIIISQHNSEKEHLLAQHQSEKDHLIATNQEQQQQLVKDHQQAVETLEQSLKEQVNKLADDHEAEISELQHKSNQKIHSLEQARDTANTKVAELKNEIGMLRETLQSSQSEVSELTQSLDEKNAQSLRLDQELGALKTDLDEKTRINEEATREINRLNALHNDVSQQLETLNSQHDAITEQKETLETNAITLEDKLSSAKQQIDTLQQQAKQHDNDFAAVAKENEQLEDQTRTLEEQLEAKENQRAELQREKDEANNSLAERVDNLSQAKEKIETLQQQLIYRSDEVQELKNEIKPLRDASQLLDELKLEYQAQTEKIAAQEASLEQLAQYENELAAEKNKTEELTTQVESEQQTKSDLENRLAEHRDSWDAAQCEITDLKQELDSARIEIERLTKQSSEDRDALTSKVIKLEQLENKRQSEHDQNIELNQALRQAEDKIEQLSNHNDELEAQVSKINDQLDNKTQLLFARDGRIQEMVEENTEKATQLRQLEEQQIDFTDTISNLETQLSEAEKQQLKVDADYKTAEQQWSTDNLEVSGKLEKTARERDILSKKVDELEIALEKANDEVDKKNMRVLQLGTQLVDYQSRQEQYLQNMAKMEDEILELNHRDKQIQNEEQASEHAAALRARDNIVEALEQQVVDADKTIFELKKHIEELQVSTVISEREPVPEPAAMDKSQLIKLQKALAQRTQEVANLRTDLKVQGDLIKVFESDSIQLQSTEDKLEEVIENNKFLENELTNAINEVNLLKQQLNQANERVERSKNIGRTPAAEPKQHQQLLYRLAALEAENREQLELINSLKTGDSSLN